MLDIRKLSATLSCVGLMLMPVTACSEERASADQTKAPAEQAAAAASEKPYEKPDGSWITITGNVTDSDADSFTLDYGDGLIIVEMDDWDWYDESSRIMPGETVRVYGKVDDDLYELRTIEAGSVYVYDRQNYYFASADDEETAYMIATFRPELPEGTWVSVSGVVKEVSGREFILDTGIRDIRVDTDELGYNPLDDVGIQQIGVGDRVFVSGALDDDFFENKEILATSVMTLTPDTL